MPDIHIVTPFSRPENKDRLIEAYRPMNIIWHPIMFIDEMVDFDHQGQNTWIFPLVIPNEAASCKVKMPGCYKRNLFIKNIPIIDDDYYVTADDDDMYESEVFDTIRLMDNDVVIISMKRGHHIPDSASEERRYSTSTLIAKPENVMAGKISAQQSFVKGHIFKKYLHDETVHHWDGLLAEYHMNDGEQTVFMPNLFALFNYYEPGRWTDRTVIDIGDIKISFGVMINDPYRFNTVLKKSALPGDLHYIVNPESATKGLNQLIEIMENNGATVAALVHQDMYFRQGWLDRVKDQIALLPENWGVAGVIGKDMHGRICGQLHDMRIVDVFNSKDIHEFPQSACCVDECVILINLKHGFRFDEDLDGFDLYGTLCVLQAWGGGKTAWIIDAFAEHYCMRSFGWFPGDDFKARYKWLYDKYVELTENIDSTVFVSKPKFETSAAPIELVA